MVEYNLAIMTLTLLDKWYLVAYSKLYKLTYVHMSLGKGLKVYVVANAVLYAEAYIVEGLVHAHLCRFIEEGTWPATIYRMVVVIEVTYRIEEVYSPVHHSRKIAKFELVVYRYAATHSAPIILRSDIHASVAILIAYGIVVE